MIKKAIVGTIVKICRFFSRNKKKIVYNSFPDFSDNSFATYIYISNHFKGYNNVWLVDNYVSKEKYIKLSSNYTNSDNLLIVKKNSFKGLFHFFSANTVFYTHGIFDSLGLISSQNKINLGHGMPLKSYGLLNNNGAKAPIANYHVATSSFYQEILSKAFGVSYDRIVIAGQTRNDFFINNRASINQVFNNQTNYLKTVLWMPTYRKSIIKEMGGVDGNVNPEMDFLSNENLLRMNNTLKQMESNCYVKIHPMDYRKMTDFNTYTNIHFLDNSSFEEKGIAMYSVFNSIDILLTDFSSVYIDFLLLNKPIGFVFSDYEEYKNSRGFIFSDPKNYMPGEIITSIDKLEDFLTETIKNDKDYYKIEREKIKVLFHEFDKDFSKILIEKVI